MTWHIPHLIQQPKTDRMEPSYFHITVCATNAFWGMRKTLLAFEFCRNSPKPSILFCVPSTKHYLEKSGETSHTLELGDKGERGHCSSQLWVRGRRGQSLPFASLSQSCSLDGMESPSQLRASLAAEHLTNFPSTLQFLAVLCPVGLTPPQVAVVPGGGGALHHGLRPPPVSQVQLVPEQGQIPLPSAVAFLPRIVHARHGQPCLVLVVLVVVVAGGLIFREVTSLPGRRLVALGLGLQQGSPGSAGPRAQPCHLCRSSSTPGKLPPRAAFAFTCPVCKRAWRGRFQSQPRTAAIPGPSPRLRAQWSGNCLLPAAWQRGAPMCHGRPLPSPHCRAAGSRGQGKWEREASHPLDPDSGSLPRTPTPCISSCICQFPDPIGTRRFGAGNSGSTGLNGVQSPRAMKKRAEKDMKAPPGGRKQCGADACLKPGSVPPYTMHRDQSQGESLPGTCEGSTASHHAVIAWGVRTKTPARNCSGLAPGRDLGILSVSSGLWHTCSVWWSSVAPV